MELFQEWDTTASMLGNAAKSSPLYLAVVEAVLSPRLQTNSPFEASSSMEASQASATKLLPQLATMHRLIGSEGTCGELE